MMEYRLNLNKRAIERFYFWGNVAMLVEALGLLLWVIAVFLYCTHWKMCLIKRVRERSFQWASRNNGRAKKNLQSCCRA